MTSLEFESWLKKNVGYGYPRVARNKMISEKAVRELFLQLKKEHDDEYREIDSNKQSMAEI